MEEIRYLKSISDYRFMSLDRQEAYKRDSNKHLFGLYSGDDLIGVIGVLVEQSVEILDLTVLETYTRDRKIKMLVNYIKKQYIQKDIKVKIKHNYHIPVYKELGFDVIDTGVSNDIYCLYNRDAHLVDRYLDIDGKVETYPVDWDNQLIVLKYLISFFDPELQYTEIEVNQIIKKHVAIKDYITIRRSLIDSGLLKRTNNGKTYWLK